MRSCDDIQPKLSLLVDGSLPLDERTEVHAHLAECDICRGLRSDLERIRTAARDLGPMAPPDHVWLDMAAQIRLEAPAAAPARAQARPRSALGQWLGLAAALVLITLGLYWIQGPPNGPTDVATAPPAAVDPVNDDLNVALQDYGRAISELEVVAARGKNTIDPAMAETVQRSLDAIDEAIAESRTALATNPDSEPARTGLFEALRRKISTLQATVLLINEMRQGDQEGAARVTEGMGRKS